MIDLKEVEAFFLEASARGYVAGAETKPIPELPGAKKISYEKGKFLCVDFYFSAPMEGQMPDSSRSFGRTIVYVDNTLVWTMRYEGIYPKAVIPFLKRVLKNQYEKGVFSGGRGPAYLVGDDGRLAYFNNVKMEGFSYFWGREEIYSADVPLTNPAVGWHKYSGYALAPLP